MIMVTAVLSYSLLITGITCIRMHFIKKNLYKTIEKIYRYQLLQKISSQKIEVDYSDINLPSLLDITNWGGTLLPKNKEIMLNNFFKEGRI